MMTLAARRVLGTMAVAGAPVTPSGPTLAIDDGFSGAGVLHGTVPDTLGSPAAWSVLDSRGSPTDGIVMAGGSAGLATVGSTAEAWIDHGADITEILATINLGSGATGSNIRRAGVIFAVDPSRSAASHVLRGEYTVWLRFEPNFKALHLLYSPDLSTGGATIVASWAFTVAASTDYALRVVIDGATVRVYLDGTERITYDATGTLVNMRYAGLSLSAAAGFGVPSSDRYRGWV